MIEMSWAVIAFDEKRKTYIRKIQYDINVGWKGVFLNFLLSGKLGKMNFLFGYFFLVVVLLHFTGVVLQKAKHVNSIKNERVFRSNKANLIWSKAQKQLQVR